MANKYDIEGLKRELLSKIDSLLASWLPDGKKEGKEWVAINPTRGDASKGSFKVNMSNGRWSEFATGKSGGDLISLYQYLKGVDFKTAYKDLASNNIVSFEEAKYAKNKDNKKPRAFEEKVEYRDIPADIPIPELKGRKLTVQFSDPETGEELYPETTYRNFEGKPVYRVTTRRNEDGVKLPIPTAYSHWIREQEIFDKSLKAKVKTGKILDTVGWHNKDLVNNRPLCGMNYVYKRIEGTVLVVEGEKAWAYAIQNLPEFACVTWRGGTNAVEKTNWSALSGRDIIILPDYDDVGQKAALKIAHQLQKINNSVRICWESLKANIHPEHWDIADEPDVNKVREYIRDNAVTIRAIESLIMDERSESDNGVADVSSQDELLSSDAGGILLGQRELRCLGYGPDNKTFFISRKRGIVISLSPDQLGNLNHLMSLMPLNFWYDLFAKKSGGIDKHKCSDTLQRWAEIKGWFNSDVIRGAGVWIERDERKVLHMGRQLLVEEEIYNVNEFESEYMYEATNDLGVRYVKALATKDSKKLIEICEYFNWASPIYGKLFAGFAAIAPMCGGLEWRPHIWVTGPSGSGKTTAISKVLAKACGKMSLFVQGDSTAAGIRQKLGMDALPVIFDEFEGENPRRLEELQRILDLARQSSSENGAHMLKGSAMGDAVEFRVRSCFAFSSINVNMTYQADTNRTTVLTLLALPENIGSEEKGDRLRKFQDFEQRIDDTLTPEYVNALQMRSFKLLPIIRKNAKIFKTEVVKHLGSAREGDQLGALCAGAYSLEYTGVIDKLDAERWIKDQDWALSTPVDAIKDHDKCLSHMMQYLMRLQDDGKYIHRTVDECISMVWKGQDKFGEADGELRRYGLRVDKELGLLYVADTHTKLAEIMQKSSYQSWNRLLLRCEGAKAEPPTRFSPGTVCRAVAIPIKVALRGDNNKLAF